MELGILFALCCSCLLVIVLAGAGIWFFTRDRNKSKGQGVIDVAARPAPAPAPAARPPQPPPAASARPASESAPTVIYSRKDVEQAKAASDKPAPTADPQATMLHIPRVKPEAPKAEPSAVDPPSSVTIRDFKSATDAGATMLHLPSIDEDKPAAGQVAEQASESVASAVSEFERQTDAIVDAGQATVESIEAKAATTAETVEDRAEAVVESGQASSAALTDEAVEAVGEQAGSDAEQAQAAAIDVAAAATPVGDGLRTILHVPPVTPPTAAEPPAAPVVPAEADPLKSELSEAPTLRWPRDEPTNTLSAASPNRAPDIREKLLGLNGPDKPYIVQESGFRITIAPTAITGHLLEISFDYITGTARLVETGPSDGGRIKADARQVLETNGWLAK